MTVKKMRWFLLSHKGWLPNKIVQVFDGNNTYCSRILGYDKNVLYLTAPASSQGRIWPAVGKTLGFSLEKTITPITVLERFLKPFPFLAVDLKGNIPYQEIVAYRPLKIIVVTGPKGGSGKTFLAANLASFLLNKGSKVLLIDGAFGQQALHNIYDAKQTSQPLNILSYFYNDPTPWELHDLLFDVAQKESDYDFLIIDTASGLSSLALLYSNIADYLLMVTNDTDASKELSLKYALEINKKSWQPEIGLILNNSPLKKDDFTSFLEKFHSNYAPSYYLGEVNHDPAELHCQKAKRLLFETFPSSEGTLGLINVFNEFISRLDLQDNFTVRK